MSYSHIHILYITDFYEILFASTYLDFLLFSFSSNCFPTDKQVQSFLGKPDPRYPGGSGSFGSHIDQYYPVKLLQCIIIIIIYYFLKLFIGFISGLVLLN